MKSFLLYRGYSTKTYLTKAPYAADKDDVKTAFEYEGDQVKEVEFIGVHSERSGEPEDSFTLWIVQVSAFDKRQNGSEKG